MDTKVITLTMFNDYPYSLCKEYDNPLTTVQVKRCLDFSSEPRFLMKQKIRLLKNLSQRHLVQLLSTQQEQNTLNLFFQYVPKRLDSVLWTLKLSAIEEIQRDLLQLAQSLAYHSVLHQFKIENVGLGKNNQLKYFLGFSFRIDRTINKQQTANRYFREVKGFFGQGGKLCRAQSPYKPSKLEYCSTMDSTSCQISSNFVQPPKLEVHKAEGKIMMKKSATVCDNLDQQIKSELNAGIVKRFSLNIFNKDIGKEPAAKEPRPSKQEQKKQRRENRLIQSEEQLCVKPENKLLMSSNSNYNTETTNQIKMIKVQELGARINKLKNYMKEVTGKTPTNNAGMSHLMVKIDGNNSDNRIFQENKLMITPNYTKMEKKIAEFRESKLYRAYGEREILYSKNNQGFQVHTKEKIQNNNAPFNGSKSSKAIEGCATEAAGTPKNNQFKMLPSYMLRKKSQLEKKSQRNSPDTSKNKHQIQQKIQRIDDPKVKEYRKMAQTDKYCQEFMYFLDDDVAKIENQKSPIDNFISRMITQQSRERSQESKKVKQGEQTSVDIQNRVKKAIRNSLKLINGLKYRESQIPK